MIRPKYCPDTGLKCNDWRQCPPDVDQSKMYHDMLVKKSEREMIEVNRLVDEIQEFYEDLKKEREDTRKILNELRDEK
jgi:hypothetical protein